MALLRAVIQYIQMVSYIQWEYLPSTKITLQNELELGRARRPGLHNTDLYLEMTVKKSFHCSPHLESEKAGHGDL